MKLRLTSILVCFVTIVLVSQVLKAGNTNNSDDNLMEEMRLKAELQKAEAAIAKQSKLLQKMLKAYGDVKTYHAVWDFVPDPNAKNKKYKLEIAFERETKNVLFCMQSFLNKNDRWVAEPEGQLLIKNNDKLFFAVTMGPNYPITKHEEKIDDPNKVTYRDIRRRIAYFYPFDLPLLFSAHPLHEILQGKPQAVETVMPKPNNPRVYPRLKLVSEWDTCAELRVNPNTYFIDRFHYYNKTSGMKMGPAFKLTSIVINQSLAEKTFDFEASLKRYNFEKTSKTNKNNPAK